MKTTIQLISLITVLLLSACANSNKAPSCSKPTLGQCLSMNQVNTLVDQGAFEQKVPPPRYKRQVQQQKPYSLIYQANNNNADKSDIPIRQPEQVLHIWLAPYEDKLGNYISAHSVFTVVQASQWEGTKHTSTLNKPGKINQRDQND